jgi:hypothetical protein
LSERRAFDDREHPVEIYVFRIDHIVKDVSGFGRRRGGETEKHDPGRHWQRPAEDEFAVVMVEGQNNPCLIREDLKNTRIVQARIGLCDGQNIVVASPESFDTAKRNVLVCQEVHGRRSMG